MYKITNRQKEQAKKLGYDIKPSSVKNKKIDVLRQEKKIASIGDMRYQDYSMYIKSKGKEYADERRRLYKIRHKCDKSQRDTAKNLACNILW
tara:strand:+ start:257 stop:532 length:276 start_codon:yes stop_codon:yes gene_type:complete